MRKEGVDAELAKVVSEANLDQASERRRIREAFKDVQLGIDHCLFKVLHDLFLPASKPFSFLIYIYI